MEDRNQEIVDALASLAAAMSRINNLWDHTGTNMIEGYPGWMPSFDEAVADVSAWYHAQKEMRMAGYRPEEAEYTLNGESVVIEEFIRVNREAVDEETAAEIRGMEAGEQRNFGGGAAPVFTLRRVR